MNDTHYGSHVSMVSEDHHMSQYNERTQQVRRIDAVMKIE